MFFRFFFKFIFISLLLILTNRVYSQGITNDFYSNFEVVKTLYFEGKYDQALHLLENINYENDKKTIQYIAVENSKGLINDLLGNYEEAINNYKNALHNNENIINKIKILNNIGIVYKSQLKFSKAVTYLSYAIDLAIKSKLSNYEQNKQLEYLYYNFGIVYFNQKEFQTAINFYKQSLEIKEEYDFRGSERVYFNLARTYNEINIADSADFYFKKAIQIREKEKGITWFRLAPYYLNYGEFLLEQGHLLESKKMLYKANSVYLSSYGKSHPYTSKSFEKLGHYYLASEAYDSALMMYQNALISNSYTFQNKNINYNPKYVDGISSIQLLSALKNKSGALLKIAQTKRQNESLKLLKLSIETADLALRIASKIRNNFINKESKLLISEEEKETFSIALSASLLIYTLTNNNAFSERAFIYAAESKALVFKNEKTIRNKLNRSVPDSILRTLNEYKTNISVYNELVFEEKLKTNPDSVKMSYWKSELFHLRNSYDSLLTDVIKIYNINKNNFRRMNHSIEILDVLPENTSLIRYFISDETKFTNKMLHVFLVDESGLFIHSGELNNEFDQSLAFVNEFTSLHSNTKLDLATFNQFVKESNTLHTLMFQPIRDKIRTKNIIIVPDEKLESLSFDALITKFKVYTTVNFADPHYLINDYTVSYAYYLPILSSSNNKPMVYAFAPSYQTNNQEENGNNFSQLDKSEDEINYIFSLIKGEAYKDENATELIFKRISGEDAVLHLALHANSEKESDDFSYLAFTIRTDSVGSENDGLLHAYEIEALNINSPMVVLSACNTGSGKIYGGEGILSLSQSFLKAGASSVVHSLWNVNDDSGLKIMQAYYDALSKGDAKNVALRNAKLNYINGSNPFSAHPYYWANYVITGDVSPIYKKNNTFILVCGSLLFIALVILLLKKKKQLFKLFI